MALTTPAAVATPATLAELDDAPAGHRRARRSAEARGSLAQLCGLALVLLGGLIGAGELHDNSFLTHLATGRWITDGHLGALWMGNADPYLSTSTGRTWVVQSWLASVVYDAADTVGGAAGIRLVIAAVCMALVAALWRLSVPARSLVGRLVAVGIVVAIGGTVWSERPLMFGLLFMAVALLAADGVVRTRWLVPVGWLWVNMHGSFPLGIVALVALAVGSRLDGRPIGRELRAVRDLAIGCLLGGLLSPVGPVLLTFPLSLLRRHEVLSNVQEWRRTDFTQGWAQLFAAVVLLALYGLARRWSFRSAVPLAIFALAGVMAARNVLVASVVLSPIVARGLEGVGSIEDRRSTVTTFATRALAVAIPLLVVATAVQGDYRLDAYPVASVDFLESRGLLDGSVSVAEEDFTGNYLEWRFGPAVQAFIDDRYDLHDKQLVDDYLVLHRGLPGWERVLDERRIDVVLWSAEEELGPLLATSPQWRLAHDSRVDDPSAPGYVVWCRTAVERCFSASAARQPPQGAR